MGKSIIDIRLIQSHANFLIHTIVCNSMLFCYPHVNMNVDNILHDLLSLF